MATLFISIGTFIVYSICVIVLAIGGLSMTSAGQTFETMFNNFFGTVIPSIAVGAFDIFTFLIFVAILQTIIWCFRIEFHEGKLRDIPIDCVLMAIVPMLYVHWNPGDNFCLLLALIGYLIPTGVMWMNTILLRLGKNGLDGRESQYKKADGRAAR